MCNYFILWKNIMRTEQETLDLCKEAMNEINNEQSLKYYRENDYNYITKEECEDGIKTLLEKKELLDFFEIDDFIELDWENDNYTITSYIDQKGWEGEGSEYWFISCIEIKETGEKIFIKFEWIYNSWDITEWETTTIVEEKEVKVKQYLNKYN